VSAAAAHDGNQGLDMPDDGSWIFRIDSDARIQQEDAISVWLQFPNVADGRAYFGFGAGGGGTLALVAAPDTNQLILQVDPNYYTFDLVSVSQTYLPNHWYRLQVNWGATGNITGQLYDSNGSTLLNTVKGAYPYISSGGIAFHANGSDKYFDTVSVGRGTVPNLLNPGSGGSGGTGSFLPFKPPGVTGTPGSSAGQGNGNSLAAAIDHVFAALNGIDDSGFAKKHKAPGSGADWLEGLLGAE
jgi:hypothetical protein